MELVLEVFVYAYLAMYIVPFIAIVLVPPVVLGINIYKQNAYKRSFSKTLVIEYKEPHGLTPAQIGYIYDDTFGSKEVIGEYLFMQTSTPSHSYQKEIQNIIKNQPKFLTVLTTEQEDQTEKNDSIMQIQPFVEQSLLHINILDANTSDSYEIRSKKMLRKAARISRWTCVYPGIALIFLSFISDIVTKEPLNITNGVELTVLLLVLHAVHVGSLYVLGMLWKHAKQKGKIKDLNSGRFVQRTTWDEVRGFREYLKKVELPRVAISIANNDKTYLTGSKVAFMISLGLLSGKQIKAVLHATSRTV